MIDRLRDEATRLGPVLSTLRRDLHAIPEIGLELPRTQRRLLDELADLADAEGVELTTGDALSSITVVVHGGAGRGPERPVVLLRGDMDALPVRELTGEPFAPDPAGPHGAAMHACGHDLHMAGLVGTLRLLVAHRAELPGDVVFMFQPGEEGHDGAGRMIGEGILEAAGRRADAAYGLHVFSSVVPAGVVATRPGPLMAASGELVVRVLGTGGHGSAPHLAADPVPAACEMVLALQTRVTRAFDVFDPVVVTVGLLQAGTRRNIIPAEARFEATIRSFSAESATKVYEAVQTTCRGIAAAHGLAVEITVTPEYPLTANNAAETAFALAVAGELFGPDRVVEMAHPIGGSEDFSRVLDEVPGCYLFVGAAADPADRAEYNHSPRARFDDAVLPDCAALLATLAYRRLTR